MGTSEAEMTIEEAKKKFGFDPETIGLRHRVWYIVEDVEEEEERGNAQIGYLAVRARDGASNKVDAEACQKSNFVGTSEDGFDHTYRYYFYKPLPEGMSRTTNTLSTLTTMLRDNLKMEPECDAEAKAIKDTLKAIKSTFKDWLGTVSIPHQMSEESTRQLLITLIDEPD